MIKNRGQLKLLLLQIRESPKVRLEELESFARYCRLNEKQIDVLNLFDTPDFDLGITSDYDALLVGGASDANVLFPEKYPFVPQAQRLLRKCIDRRQPVFASCFGYQLAVLALGGEIIHDGDVYEMGTIPISLTKEARDDPVFRSVPDGFMAVSVHKQKSLSAPPGTIPLAHTEICNHSFKVHHRPFWAFQFHPEVDKQILIERLTFYKAHYTDDDGHLERVLAAAQETPEANHLCGSFIDHVLLG
ncbi:aminotransferase [Hahella sp. CCB-MM4]|uniref:type 1 glutamine amidotransferase n=1 Tax=Hahella sp. (strain CCB-MM4) TaxID=1926491 RepID=UPI000B9A8806|nr:type 1 glutamine amidotransferase [Hahella sp. CCB-MM4]OZG72025.1 aminotransferase [Hahella sp. CCB-MM4]